MALVKNLIRASVAVAAVVGATNANAAVFVLSGVGPGISSTDFGNTSTTGGAISDQFQFTVPAGFVSSSIISIAAEFKDIVLTQVDLDGTLFSQDSTGGVEIWTLTGPFNIAPGLHTINVIGTWDSKGGSYAGTLNFGAVPETGTWAMMALGLGLAGAAMRRTRRQKVAVSFG